MIGVTGNLLLYFALGFALLQTCLPCVGFRYRTSYAIGLVRPSLYAQCVSLLLAYGVLTWAFISNDFHLTYVAANSHPDLPLFYRMTAIWGAHEGSILLWISFLSIWSLMIAFKPMVWDMKMLSLAIMGSLSSGFLLFLLLTSNPFLSTKLASIPQDLNPLLQDPGFIIHPPMLYAGYVGLAAAFAITLSGLLLQRVDAEWASVTRYFTIAAWCFLTLGIILGSWWSYRVLGWGGFWFWDPVENASLLPWLASTALIHLLVLVERRNLAIGWASLVALLCFSLSILGTFLVRSGVLVSAHTFANDPSRGVFLLGMLGLFNLIVMVIYRRTLPQLSFANPRHWFSRESKLLLNSALLLLAMLTVLLGTLYPLLMDALHLGAISVGAPYFNQVLLPIALITLAMMGLVPFVPWHLTSFYDLRYRRLLQQLLLSLLSAILVMWLCQQADLISLLSLWMVFWLMSSLLHPRQPFSAMRIAHLGFATLIAGLILSSMLSIERTVKLRPGLATQVGPYQFFFIDTETVKGPNYRGIRANFEVLKGDRSITHLQPEKRIYPTRGMIMTTVAINAAIFRDLYLALGEPLDKNAWSIRIYYKPFIRFIWFGGCLMIGGGLLAIIRKRKQV